MIVTDYHRNSLTTSLSKLVMMMVVQVIKILKSEKRIGNIISLTEGIKVRTHSTLFLLVLLDEHGQSSDNASRSGRIWVYGSVCCPGCRGTCNGVLFKRIPRPWQKTVQTTYRVCTRQKATELAGIGF